MTTPNLRSELSAMMGFSGNDLDRRAELRDQTDVVAGLAARPDARAVILAGDIPVLQRVGEDLSAWFDLAAARALAPALETVFLGTTPQGAGRFGHLIDKELAETLKADPALHVVDLRTIAAQGLVQAAPLGALGGAKSMLDWHMRHRFCAQCGAATHSASSGWKRQCVSCQAQHFPRTDPVVIMLVVRGERCFLARQARFQPGMYSCIAGFVEPGETFEDAVRRETFEEAGLRAGKVRYVACQPWPFPSSLMIGCMAEALGDEITLDRLELEDGRWFSRDEALAILERRHEGGITCPPRMAIANALLDAWARGRETP